MLRPAGQTGKLALVLRLTGFDQLGHERPAHAAMHGLTCYT
jgi:hypothetical protein